MNPFYLTALGAIVAAVALPFAIRTLIRCARLDTVATVEIAPEHRLELPAGELVLHLAGPLGKRGLGALSFALVDPRGAAVSGAPILMRSRRSSGRWGVLLGVRRFAVPEPGPHRLTVANIPQDGDLSGCAIVLARPQGVGLVLAVLAVVFAGVLLVVSTVLGVLLWTGAWVV